MVVDFTAERVLDTLSGLQVINVSSKGHEWSVDFLEHGSRVKIEIRPIKTFNGWHIYEFAHAYTLDPPDIIRIDGKRLIVLNVLEFEILSDELLRECRCPDCYMCRFVRRLDQ